MVQSEEIKCDSIFLHYPYRVEIKDSLAIILDLHPESYYLHAFTYPEWKHITSFGKRGEGPGEVLLAERVRICSPDSVWVLDSNRRQILRWRISSLLGIAEQVEEIVLDDHLIRTLDFCKTNDGFLVTDYTGNYRYHVLDLQGKIKESVGYIPSKKNVNDAGKTALAQAWRSFMDYNPNDGILAMMTQLGEVIEIFNLKTNTHSVHYGPSGEPIFSISESEAIPKGIKGFNEVVVADSCIYAVFDGGKYIYVFDFDGRPLNKFTLVHSAFGLVVSKKGLFTTSTDTDIPLRTYQ